MFLYGLVAIRGVLRVQRSVSRAVCVFFDPIPSGSGHSRSSKGSKYDDIVRYAVE